MLVMCMIMLLLCNGSLCVACVIYGLTTFVESTLGAGLMAQHIRLTLLTSADIHGGHVMM